MTQLVVPNIGDLHDVTIIEIFVKPGDAVIVDQDVVTVESDKSALQVGATAAGVVTRLLVQLGDKVNAGTVLAELEPASTEAAQPAAVPAATRQVSEPVQSPPAPESRRAAAPPAASPTPQGAAASSAPHASPGRKRLFQSMPGGGEGPR